jgi:hypothetical protein
MKENVMIRKEMSDDDIIDLGAASEVTQGGSIGHSPDDQHLVKQPLGLSAE